MPPESTEGARRYLKTREKAWAGWLARQVGRTGLSPNAISVLSMVFAAAGAACFYLLPTAPCQIAATGYWLGAAACIQLRLLCNLLDGMVAIEGGKKSPVGGLYNEVPDRVADVLFLAAAGYCAGSQLTVAGVPLGWTAAVLAMMTAYIRVLGGTLTGNQSFMGPMAKQHRMALLTLACLGSVAEVWLVGGEAPAYRVIYWALVFMVLGTAVTCWRRLRLIGQDLNKKSSSPP